ncbi:MAG: pyridoxal-phosphate dependent enzyme, partial [Spirochaetia bacterium]|nr:pyridoxal-phosphate dependent enzyme [Spirochaetia bacterium]
GGSSAKSLLGHVEAVKELKAPVECGEMPVPDMAVVALASAGTAVGLAAGFADLKLPTRVIGVATAGGFCVARLWAFLQLMKLALVKPALFVGACLRLRIDTRFRGPRYGLPSEASENARRLAAESGIHLDPVYGAKAFAFALHLARKNRLENILFWQTFSTTQMESLLEKAPLFSELPVGLKNLLTG